MKETLTFERWSLEEAQEILNAAYKFDSTAFWYGDYLVNGDFVRGKIEKNDPAASDGRGQKYKVSVEYDSHNAPSIGEKLKELFQL